MSIGGAQAPPIVVPVRRVSRSGRCRRQFRLLFRGDEFFRGCLKDLHAVDTEAVELGDTEDVAIGSNLVPDFRLSAQLAKNKTAQRVIELVGDIGAKAFVDFADRKQPADACHPISQFFGLGDSGLKLVVQ